MRNLYEQFKDSSTDDLNQNLCNACDAGDLEAVKFLLTSPKLKKHADINYENDYAFNSACDKGHLDIVKYLITSPDLKTKIDIHDRSEVAFEIACASNSVNILQYFILELNIEKTPKIQAYFDFMDGKNNPTVSAAKNMFILRELNEQFKKNLKIDKADSKKPKI